MIRIMTVVVMIVMLLLLMMMMMMLKVILVELMRLMVISKAKCTGWRPQTYQNGGLEKGVIHVLHALQ